MSRRTPVPTNSTDEISREGSVLPAVDPASSTKEVVEPASSTKEVVKISASSLVDRPVGSDLQQRTVLKWDSVCCGFSVAPVRLQ